MHDQDKRMASETPVFAPALDEPDFDPQRAEGGVGRQALIFAFLVAALASAGGVAWMAYAPLPAPAPIIEAEAGPFKTPEAPAVSQANANRAVFEALERASAPRSAAAGESVRATPAAAAPAKPEPIDLRPKAEAGTVPLAPVRTEPLPPPAPRPLGPPVSGDGPFVVQVAAVRSEEAAREAWAQAARQAPNLARARMDVRRADLGQQGVFFRVRAGFFADRAAAAAFCADLTAAGLACMVAAR